MSVNKIACLFPGLSIAFEQPHKRADITYFCLPKTIEAVWNFLEKRNIVRSTQLLEIITFGFSFGILAAINTVGESKLKGVT